MYEMSSSTMNDLEMGSSSASKSHVTQIWGHQFNDRYTHTHTN